MYGGYTAAASSQGNTVNIKAGTINGNVYGGYTDAYSNSTGNTINIYGGIITGGLYGGKSQYNTPNPAISGNTINIFTKGLNVTALDYVQNLNFFLPANIANEETMLTVTGTANLKGTTLGAVAQAGLELNGGDKVYLVTAGTLNTDDTLKTLTAEDTVAQIANVTSATSIATDTTYTLNISKDGNSIIATVEGEPEGTPSTPSTPIDLPSDSPPGNSATPVPKASTTLPERTKSLAETMAGSISLLNGGLDMTVAQSFDNAAAAVEAAKSEHAGVLVEPTVVNGFVPR